MNKEILRCLLGLFALSAASAASTSLYDDFSTYTKNVCFPDGTTFGNWTNAFSGYGCVKVGTDGTSNWLDEAPAPSLSSSETHASLALGPSFSAPLDFRLGMRTASQLRQNAAPNAWEVAWAIWDYTDNTHFYYFMPKPNGWELGKEDPAYPGAQRFLASGASPVFPIGSWYDVRISQNQNTMTVYVNGQAVTTFTDTERPYISGRIGVYNEDSHVQFRNVAVNYTAPTPLPAPSPAPVPSTAWQNVSFAPQTGGFEAKFDATPSAANMDGVIGLSNGPASGFNSLAAIVRFNNTGTIDARNSGVYSAATAIRYSPGTTYRFRLDVNVANHTYSAYVTPSGGSEQLIGSNYAFRAEQSAVSQLNNMGSFADSGTETVGTIGISALAASTSGSTSNSASSTLAASPTNVWKNTAFANQTLAFEAKFDAMPNAANIDGVLGLSNGPASGFTNLAAIVRFNNSGTIDARNGGSYAAANAIRYTPGVVYHFRLDVNLAKHTYSAYVTPNGGAEVLIGSGYAFRTEQASVTQLNNYAAFADSGTESNGPISVAPWVPTAAVSERSVVRNG